MFIWPPTPFVRMTLDTWRTGLAAATTIAARLPILYSAALTGSPTAVRETQRMYSEKASAAWQGSLAAGSAMMHLWMRAATGGWSAWDPAVLARAADACLAPARRTCQANARRLTRARRKGAGR